MYTCLYTDSLFSIYSFARHQVQGHQRILLAACYKYTYKNQNTGTEQIVSKHTREKHTMP